MSRWRQNDTRGARAQEVSLRPGKWRHSGRLQILNKISKSRLTQSCLNNAAVCSVQDYYIKHKDGSNTHGGKQWTFSAIQQSIANWSFSLQLWQAKSEDLFPHLRLWINAFAMACHLEEFSWFTATWATLPYVLDKTAWSWFWLDVRCLLCFWRCASYISWLSINNCCSWSSQEDLGSADTDIYS